MQLRRRLGALDAMFLYLERPEQPMNVGAVCVVEGKLPYARFVKHLAARLHLLPRYRQRAVPAPFNLGHPTWEDDPEFDLQRHVFRHRLDPPGGIEQLRDRAGRIFGEVLRRDQPLWEMHVVEGLDEERSALIMKSHHCMVDGISGIGLAQVLFDATPEPKKVRKVPYRPRPLPDTGARLYDALWDNATERVEHWTRLQQGFLAFGYGFQNGELLKAVQKFTSTMGNFLIPLSPLPFNGPLTGDRRMAWRSFSLPSLQPIRNQYGCTVNDVALTLIGGAIRRYLLRHNGHHLGKAVRMLVPVNIRPKEELAALGNRISFLPADVPLHPEQPVERLLATSALMREMKTLRVAGAIALMFETLQGLPPAAQAWSLESIGNASVQAAIRHVSAIPPANLVCTNVPGPQVPMYLLGHRLSALYPTLPVCLEMGLSIAISSYCDQLTFTITEDGCRGPGAELLAAYVEESYHELHKAAATNGAARPRAYKRKRVMAKS